jgi:D-glycerate 3-kinase
VSFSLAVDAPGALTHYEALARDLVSERPAKGEGPLLLSVGGWPGSGKSTLVQYLTSSLQEKGYPVAAFSLDDVYLSRNERARLAETVHPLLVRRGVPGTHDVELALGTVAKLQSAGTHEETRLPRFDKLTDDRYPESEWPVFRGRPDFLILDAWFWGAVPAPDPMSLPSLNETERLQDTDGAWRRWVNATLARGYPELFALFERHVQLEAPSWEATLRFRVDQEKNLYESRGLPLPDGRTEQLRSFLERFERIARLPRRHPKTRVFQLDEAHAIVHAVDLAST